MTPVRVRAVSPRLPVEGGGKSKEAGVAPTCIVLRDCTPGDEVSGDLEIHLEGEVGWARATRFNRAIHPVQVTAHRVEEEQETWTLKLSLVPDAWHPAEPTAAVFEVKLRSGRGGFRGTFGDCPVAGDAERFPSPLPGDGVLHLCCQQFLTGGRKDFRDLRLELPVASAMVSPGRAVTLHERWPLADAAVVSQNWVGRVLHVEVIVSHPASDAPSEGPRRIVVTVKAERRGRLLRGRWRREDDGREGDLWGELRVDPPANHRSFAAPGMVVGAEDIAAVRTRIAAGGQWESAWALLRDRAETWKSWQPRPHARPAFVHWSEPGPVRDLKEDCEAAWGNALLAALGQGADHATAAGTIIRAWATTFAGIADIGGHLSTAYCVPAMVWAADLLRAGGSLDPAVDAVFRRCLEEVIRPIARTELHFNNWRTWANHLEVCIAVYCQRGDWFDLALEGYRKLLASYTGSPRGITSETGRDLVHAQMGLVPMIATSELAWRHGVDLYGERQMRLRAAVELHGPFAMGRLDDWPLHDPPREVGRVWPMYEAAVRHYRGRLGLPMPRSCAVIAANRPEGFDRFGWGTLLCPWEAECPVQSPAAGTSV